MYKDGLFNNNLNKKNNIEKKNMFFMSSIEVIDDLLNVFFKQQIDKKITFLIYHNLQSKNSCEKVMEIICSKLNFIKIDASKLMLYKSPIFFLIKQIIKHLPLVSADDKKVLWDRIFLFLKSFDIKIYDNKIMPAEIVFSEINYDDPIEFIKKEIGDILRIYNINKFINIYLENLDLCSYKFAKKCYFLLNILFSEFIQFRIIAQLYKMEAIKSLNERFPGNNDYNQLINFELKNSTNYFICDDITSSY